MNYNENLLLGIQFAYIILGILTATFIGSVGCGIWLFLCKGTAKFYVKDAMKFLKLILACFILPMIPFFLYPMLKNHGGFEGTYMVKTMVHILMIVIQVWLVSTAIVLITRLINYIFMCRVCADNIPVEDNMVLNEVNQWKQALHIRRKVRLYINPNVSSPAIMRHWGYQILLPPYEMTQQEMTMAVLHELVHLKHKDILTKNMCFVVNALHGFNPLTRLVKSHVSKWAEVLCDLTTCEVGKERFTRQEYYYSIMNLMNSAGMEFQNDAMFALCENKSLLEFRVQMFAEANKEKQTRLRGVFYFVSVFMVLVTTAVFGVSTKATSVWFESSLMEEGEETLVVAKQREMSYEEMFQNVKVSYVETYRETEEIEKIYMLQPDEAKMFEINMNNTLQAGVHVFCDECEYILGCVDGEKAVYINGLGVTAESFVVDEETKGLFIKNVGDAPAKIEISIAFTTADD